jgi:sugar phosphate isomerase/epimerase
MFAFSTLACPEWTPLEVVRRAADMGFEGIEWRGGPDGHAGPQLSRSARQAVRTAMDDRGLSALSVTTYTDLVHSDRRVRAASVDQLVTHAEVAVALGANCIRAFLGERPGNVSMEASLERAADGLREASGQIGDSGVAIVVEPHDDFLASATIAGLMESIGGPDIGVVWDAGNSWSIGERPELGLGLLHPWLRYVQVKDGTGRLPDWRLRRIGAGDVPLGDALAWLVRSGTPVPVSIEWERPWHPELPPAAEALPEGLAHLRSLLDAMSAPVQEAT